MTTFADMKLHKIDRNHADASRLLKIYENSFPENERIESTEYYNMLEAYSVDIYGIYEEEQLVGLLNIMTRPENKIVYFWFFAIDEQHRNKGIGGEALDQLIELYPEYQLVLDMEPYTLMRRTMTRGSDAHASTSDMDSH